MSGCLGCFVGSSWHPVLRALPLVLWGLIVVCLFLSADGLYLATGVALYSLVSLVAGAWAYRSIQQERIRILASFCGGYLIGSFAGILGTVAGAILGALLAKWYVPPNKRRSAIVRGDRGD